MNIDNYLDAIKNCRFCFMCRHLSAIGNVTFTEADTPRVRAAMAYGITLYPENLANRDYIDTIYRSDLSELSHRLGTEHAVLQLIEIDIVAQDLEPVLRAGDGDLAGVLALCGGMEDNTPAAHCLDHPGAV